MEDYNEMYRPNPHCPVLDVDGVIANGKQYDLDISLPEDTRDVIYGTVKNCFKEPIKNAVVKLIEVDFEKDGKKKREPISHTFTDEYGEFVFGPLCPGKHYAIDIWVNEVRHFNICAKCHHEGDCLKGDKKDKCDCIVGGRKDKDYDKECDKDYNKCCKPEPNKDCNKICK